MPELGMRGHEVKPTPYGFTWGPMRVERLMETLNGGVILSVDGGGPSNRIEIYVSPKGKSVRAWRSGKELKEEPDG